MDNRPGTPNCFPSREPAAKQHLVSGDTLAVVTKTGNRLRQIESRADIAAIGELPVFRIRIRAESKRSAMLVVALRPYNPEGVQFIDRIAWVTRHNAWQVNRDTHVWFDRSPQSVVYSDYASGDVLHRLGLSDAGIQGVHCPVGMATSAAMFPVFKNSPTDLEIQVPLNRELKREIGKSMWKGGSWREKTAGGVQFQANDPEFESLFEAARATLLMLSAKTMVPGPYTYRRFWFRDACLMLHAFLSMGYEKRCRRILSEFPALQTRSGYFKSQEGEWDSNGQVLWIMDRYQRLTGENLPESWMAAVEKGAEWIWRKRTPSTPGTLHGGLLPSGFSAEHLGPNDFYYWDDFWALAGLNAASRLWGLWGNETRQKQWGERARRFRKNLFRIIEKTGKKAGRRAMAASPYRRMDAGAVGSLVADYPLGLTEPGDPKVMETVDYLLKNCFFESGFFQDMIHSGINAYLTLDIAQTLLRAGRKEYMDLVEKIADMASPTGQWPEAVHPATGGGCMGDGQHGWAAAEWLMMIRSLFVREEGNELILGSGVPQRWTKKDGKLRFGPTPTPHGTISVSFQVSKKGIHARLKGQWRGQRPTAFFRVPGFCLARAPKTEEPVFLKRNTAS